MPYLFNVAYLLLLLLLSPWLLYKSLTTGKYRRGMWTKLTGGVSARAANGRRRVWFHGVSVGEIHLLRPIVAQFKQRHPDVDCVVSTTTDTGLEEARKTFPTLDVILWPLDFTWAIGRALCAIQPDLVVFAEGEIWPNFLAAARRSKIKLAIVNGRMSPRSSARFQKVVWFARRFFASFDLVAAQTNEYARSYRALGATNVVVTGSVKYDGAVSDRNNPRTLAMRQLLGIGPNELVWVAGSTQTPEEQIVLDIYRRAREEFGDLRLILVPRQKDRFEEVARLLRSSGLSFVRRSALDGVPPQDSIMLVDTIGELSAVWGMADIAFVGGSLDGQRGGQNMIEPAAYGAAVLFGPHTWNFKHTVTQMLEQRAAVQVQDAAELEDEILRLASDVNLRKELGATARGFVLGQQGATAKTVEHLGTLLAPRSAANQAA